MGNVFGSVVTSIVPSEIFSKGGWVGLSSIDSLVDYSHAYPGAFRIAIAAVFALR